MPDIPKKCEAIAQEYKDARELEHELFEEWQNATGPEKSHAFFLWREAHAEAVRLAIKLNQCLHPPAPPVILGPRCNRRVSCDTSVNNARSESALAINPLNPYNMVGASKRFTDPSIYAFSLAAYASFDGGLSWTESSLMLPSDWAGTSDPALAWDGMGNVYLLALPFGSGSSLPTKGMAVYKSTDGGRNWGPPNLIHSGAGDDKQWIAADTNPASPHYGNVYAAWDHFSQLGFAFTTDHGATWKGIGGQPSGTTLPGVSDSFSPDVVVAADGTVYIIWLTGQAGNMIKFVKSTDGGNSFSAPVVAVSGVTSLRGSLPITEGWPHFPNATFRVLTLVAGYTGSTKTLIITWADMREGESRIYFRRSTDGGNTWQGPSSGQPLLPPAGHPTGQQHFHPQIATTPTGEVGCAFYEFGQKAPSGPFLIDVILAVSTDNGATFAHQIKVTDRAWDPSVDAPIVHETTHVTFIGEYFGLDASNLGFFPFWTDTRTGVQEIFVSRIAIKPADIYIRDSSLDVGLVHASPNPNDWEAPDLIVRRQPDGETNFTNEDLLRNGVTDHYVYGRVTNRGPNSARNVKLAVTVGNYPSLIGLPGAEFRYPQDWYEGDWNTPALRNNHLFLGESDFVTIPSGTTKIVGPIVWPAAQIPPSATWHPCLLAEARADNDDVADATPGSTGCGIDADSDPCSFGSYFWGNNNVCQRNLSYAVVPPITGAHIELPFLVGSAWSQARFMEVMIDKGEELATIPMRLRMEKVALTESSSESSQHLPQGEIILVDGGRVRVRAGGSDLGEIVASPGTIWRSTDTFSEADPSEVLYYGGEKVGEEWMLIQRQSGLSFAVEPGEMRRLTLSFQTPPGLQAGTNPVIRIIQRNNKQVYTGSILLQLQVDKTEVVTKTTRRNQPRRTIKRAKRQQKR